MVLMPTGAALYKPGRISGLPFRSGAVHFGAGFDSSNPDNLSTEAEAALRQEKIARLTAHLEHDGFTSGETSLRIEDVFFAVFRDSVQAVQDIANHEARAAAWQAGMDAQQDPSKIITLYKQLKYAAQNPKPVLSPDLTQRTWVPGHKILRQFNRLQDDTLRQLAVKVLSFLEKQRGLIASKPRPEGTDPEALETWMRESRFQLSDSGWEAARQLGWVTYEAAGPNRMSNFKILLPSATMGASESERSKPMAEPRSGSVSIGGIPWLARMIDKARLEAAGEIDNYDLEYPCPMDRGLLGNLGIDAKTFQKIAVESKTDEEILEQLKKAGAKV